MATITLTDTVDHSLPTYFAGVGCSAFRAQNDFGVTAYRAALQNLNPEVLRYSPWGPVATVASPTNGDWNAMKALGVHLGTGVGVIMGPCSGAPNSSPSSKADNDTTNLRGNGTGQSPTDAAAWYEKWVQDGVNVIGFEAYNEPANCVYTGNGGGPWYSNGSTPTQTDINKAESWAYVEQRAYYNAMIAKASAHGWTPPRMMGGVIGSAQPYAQGWAKNFMSGVLLTGDSWPYSDANWPYFDTYTFHPYQNGSTNQGRLNSVFWDPNSFATSNDSVATKSFLRNLRAYMDANGGSTKKLAWNESGHNGTDAFAGLVDVAETICGCVYQAAYKIDYFTQWSMNTGTVGSPGWPICDSSTYTLNTRMCALRDLCFYFVRNYKRQVAGSAAIISGSGSTPSSGENSGQNNSVSRIVCAAGLNANGTSRGILLANLDLSSSETVTINLPSVPGGQITGRKLTQSTTTSGTTLLPAITPIAAASSFAVTLAAGDALLLEMPVSVGGGGDTTPPALSDTPVAYVNAIGFSWNEPLDQTSVPATTDFTVTVNGGGVSVSSVVFGGQALINIGIPTIDSTDVVTYAYTPGANPIRDVALNNAASLSGTANNQTPVVPRRNTNPRTGGSRNSSPVDRIAGLGGGGI